MESLLIAVIILALLLAAVLVTSIASILWIKQRALHEQVGDREEDRGNNSNNTGGINEVNSYTTSSVYAVKAPKIEDVSLYMKLEEVFNIVQLTYYNG